jgi:ribulose-5-phosphate 4-epimerase/fuculose-1-phosphate aldolase
MESVSLLPSYCRRLYERELVSSTGGNLSIRTDRGSILISPTGEPSWTSCQTISSK